MIYLLWESPSENVEMKLRLIINIILNHLKNRRMSNIKIMAYYKTAELINCDNP